MHTVELGLYTEAEDYRRSDTVLATEDNTELLTSFPWDVESNVVGRE